MTIDWNAPLEAVHEDGRVVEVTLSYGPDDDGDYITNKDSRVSEDSWHGDGRSYCRKPWRIRNRTENPALQYPVELVERMVALVRDMAKVGRECFKDAGTVCERDYAAACDIEEDLPQPADPDEIIAKETAKEYGIDGRQYEGLLAAIKRVRAEG